MEERHAWGDRLDLGDDALDREHHLQFALVSGATEAMEQGRPWMARRLIEQLAGYSAAHFAGEELLMENAEYPQIDDHRREHRSMLEHVEEIRQLLDGGEHDLAVPMALDLMNGLASHISASDRQFADHSKGRPGAMPLAR